MRRQKLGIFEFYACVSLNWNYVELTGITKEITFISLLCPEISAYNALFQ